MKHILNRAFKGDKVIWSVIAILFLISMLTVYSATSGLSYTSAAGSTTFYLFRHTRFLIAGMVITYFVHRIPYIYFSKLAQYLYMASIPLLLMTLFIGVSINSASRWLVIPGLGIEFQTSDMAKLALIMYIARVMSLNQDSEESLKGIFKHLIISIGVICALVLPANFSTAALLFLTSWVLMYVGRMDKRYLFNSLGIVAGAFMVFIIVILLFAPDNQRIGGRLATWKNRIVNFSNNDEAKNMQANHAKIAIATGGLFGKGPGNSTQRNFLPQAYSDFIFAIIVEEYGLGIGIFVLLLYLYLLFRAIVIVRKTQRVFAALLAVGLTISLVIQALVNIAVAVNLFPVTGQTLPFISMGGTSILFTSCAFGIILSVSRTVEEDNMNEKTISTETNLSK